MGQKTKYQDGRFKFHHQLGYNSCAKHPIKNRLVDSMQFLGFSKT